MASFPIVEDVQKQKVKRKNLLARWNTFWTHICRSIKLTLRHFFLKAQLTSNKMVRKKRSRFWDQFLMQSFSRQICSLTNTTNQNKNAIFCVLHTRQRKNFISTKSRLGVHIYSATVITTHEKNRTRIGFFACEQFYMSPIGPSERCV